MRSIENLLSAYTDGELKNREYQIVNSHIKGCKGCLRRLSQINAITNALSMPEDFDVPDGLAQKLDRLATQFGAMPSRDNASLERKSHKRATKALNKFSTLRMVRWQKYAMTAAAFVVILVAAATTAEFFSYDKELNNNIQDKNDIQKPGAKGENSLTTSLHPLVKEPDREIANHDLDDGLNRILKDEIDVDPESLGYQAIKTYKRVADAKAALPYDFPVPVNTSERKLKGLYIEMGDVLYITYEGGVFLIYHASTADPSKAITSVGYIVDIRGYKALAVENESRGQLRSLGWHEDWHGTGLNITVYGTQNVKMTELVDIARSMK
ncbi:MAG TPA: zf-HC2 domain-containing protein [Anaerolineae bacterium]|jgi:hypothetical protein|nr:zf-HC2 domain-containing protein [Anaerolineae bacterium]